MDSPAGRLGLSVCYDLRFPELYQHLRFGLGAEVLLVPSAFTVVTGKRGGVALGGSTCSWQCDGSGLLRPCAAMIRRFMFGSCLNYIPTGR